MLFERRGFLSGGDSDDPRRRQGFRAKALRMEGDSGGGKKNRGHGDLGSTSSSSISFIPTPILVLVLVLVLRYQKWLVLGMDCKRNGFIAWRRRFHAWTQNAIILVGFRIRAGAPFQ